MKKKTIVCVGAVLIALVIVALIYSFWAEPTESTENETETPQSTESVSESIIMSESGIGSESESITETEVNSKGGMTSESESSTEQETASESEVVSEVESEVVTESEVTELETATESEVVEPETNSETVNTEKEEPEEPKEPAWTVTDLDKTMYAKSSVNVRSGPGSSYDKEGSLVKNEEVHVTGKCNEYNWYRIEYKGAEGYVSASYLVDERIVEEEPEKTEPENTEDNTVVNTEEGGNESKLPTTPEPEYGTVSFENENEKEEWYWNFVDISYVWDGYQWWWRITDHPFGPNYDEDKVEEIARSVYPIEVLLDMEPGPEGEELIIEKPTFWVYLGDGPYCDAL